jgi:hypothetical protein
MNTSMHSLVRIEKKIIATEFTFSLEEVISLKAWMLTMYASDLPPCIDCPDHIFGYCMETGYQCPTFSKYIKGSK